MKTLYYLLVMLLLSSCQESASNELIVNSLKLELAKSRQVLSDLKATKEFLPLIHLVYLDLKEDISVASKRSLLNAIGRLEEIPEVKQLETGHFKDLNDPRAMSHFEVVFQMSFKDTFAYKNYQIHPTHLALKETAKRLLASPPVTYDYWIEN